MRSHAIDIDAAQSLQDTLLRETTLLPVEAIEHGMKRGQQGIGCIGDIEWGQLSASHRFSEQPREQLV